MKNSLTRVGLLMTIFIYHMNPVWAQWEPKSLTDYRSERTSVELVDQTDEFLLVENGMFLSVLGMDDNGQLSLIYESQTPYCDDEPVISTDINSQYILFYFGTHIILENFLTGEIKRADNVPVRETGDLARASFLGDHAYEVRLDSNYLYDISTNELIKTVRYSHSVENNTVYHRIRDNHYVVEFFDLKKTFSFEAARKLSTTYMFEGIVFQRFADNFTSFTNDLYFVHSNGIVDTVSASFPLVDMADRRQNSRNVLMSIERHDEIILSSYDTDKQSFVIQDTLRPRVGFSPGWNYFVNDTTYLNFDLQRWFLYDMNTKVQTNLDLCFGYYLQKTYGSVLIFENYGLPPMIYDLRLNKLSPLIDESYAENIYFTHIKKGKRSFVMDMQYLNLPYYEISDTVYTHQLPNNSPFLTHNGLRTSILQASDNYMFSLGDDDIIVLDSSVSEGYRSRTLVNHPSIMGMYSSNRWFVYRDDIFGVLPVEENGTKFFRMTKIHLPDLSVTDLSGAFNYQDSSSYCHSQYYQNLSSYFPNQFVIYENKILNMQNDEVLTFPPSLQNVFDRNVVGVWGSFDKYVVFTDRRMIEFSYPEFQLLKITDLTSFGHLGRKFFTYLPESDSTWVISDGVQHEKIPDGAGFNMVNKFNKSESAFFMINPKTKMIRVYTVAYDAEGYIKITLNFEESYITSRVASSFSYNDYIAFSFNITDDLFSYIFDLKTKNTYKIQGPGPRELVHYGKDFIIFLDRNERLVKKVDINGQTINSISYPSDGRILDNLPDANDGHAGLFAFRKIDFKSDESLLFFDSDAFEFVFDTGCRDVYFKYPAFGQNILYREGAYCFNAELDERGRQIYKIENTKSGDPSSTQSVADFPVRIFPNPAMEYIDIHTDYPCEVTSIKVLDIQGQSQNVKHSPCSTRMDISHLPAGVYIVHYTIGQTIQSQKLVKM